MFRKNVASQNVYAQMNARADGAPLTTSVGINVDNGTTYGAGGGTLSHLGSGLWRYTFTQAETNYGIIGYQFTHASGVNLGGTIVTTAADPTDTVRFGLTALPNAAANAAGGLPVSAAGGLALDTIKTQTDKMTFTVANQIDANVLKVGGTTQTARDLGASVLLSSGTGTGQLDFTSGVVKSNLVQILASAISGTAAQISAAFAKFFDKASPTGTINSLPDAVAGAASGIAIVGSQMVVPNTQKVDVETIKTRAVTCSAGVTVLASVGTASTSTAQTGDSFARIGATGSGLTSLAQASVCSETRLSELDPGTGGKMAAEVDLIKGYTDDIGAAGAGLTAVPWNAAWDAEVQSEVQDAIEVNHLDHLLAADYDPASKPGVATALLNEMVENDAGVSRFTANALEQAPSGTGASAASIADAVWDEAIADHTGAGSFGAKNQKVVPSETLNDYKATGFSTHAAADVWSVGTRVLTAGTNIVLAKGVGLTGLNDIAAGAQMDLVNAPNATAVTAIQSGLATPTNITAGTITTVTNLTNAPTTGDLTATMKASVNAEVDAALNTAIPGSPTADSINERIVAIDAYGAPPSAATIKTAMEAAGSHLALILADTNELQTDWGDEGRLDLLIDSLIAELAKVPKSDSTVSWNATALAAIGDAVEDEVVEGTITHRQLNRLLLAVLTGKSSGGGTATLTFRDIGDTKDRLVVTVDANGNRTAVGTRDGS